jgi:hypothetical protein
MFSSLLHNIPEKRSLSTVLCLVSPVMTLVKTHAGTFIIALVYSQRTIDRDMKNDDFTHFTPQFCLYQNLSFPTAHLLHTIISLSTTSSSLTHI